VVCQDVELKGDITISSGIAVKKTRASLHSWLYRTGTIVHPKATIFAIAGPIVIGANCIIEEAAIIVNRCGCMRMTM
jgi:dynactin 6